MSFSLSVFKRVLSGGETRAIDASKRTLKPPKSSQKKTSNCRDRMPVSQLSQEKLVRNICFYHEGLYEKVNQPKTRKRGNMISTVSSLMDTLRKKK